MSTVGEVLRLPTYQRFLVAAVCSGVGVWIFQTALYWAALQSGSTETVGLLVAVISIPSLVLTLPAGLLTDRAGPFRLLFVGQAAPALACAAGILAVSANGSIAFGPAAAVTLVAGTAYALWSVPALVYVTRIVEPRLLGSAIGLMVLQYAIGRIVGGALGGYLAGLGGAGLAFGVCAALFGLGALAVLTLPRVQGLEGRSGPVLRGMAEALHWMRRAPATVVLVAFAAVASLFSYTYIPLLGALSRDVIGAGPSGLGILTACSGAGMFLSALTVNAVGVRVGRGRGVAGAMIIGAIAMALLGQSTVLVVSIGLVAIVAYLSSVRSSLGQFLLQALAPPRMRGRVASVSDFIGQIMSIIGSLAAGLLAASFGVPLTLLACGAAIVLTIAVIVVAWPRILRLDVDGDAHPMVAGSAYVEGSILEPHPEPG
jgi:MFS family permease